MIKEEYVLIESQFKGLATLFETKLKASEGVICGKVSSLQEKFEETKSVVDDHVCYHNSLNRRIAWASIKGGVVLFIFIVCVVLILGMKDGVIPLLMVKMLG